MKENSKYNFYIGILVTVALFAAVLFLFNPSYNTDVDIYFLYTLSGGYGNEPSALLHYSDIAHPLVASIVAGFFKVYPGFNWYSFFLVLFHFISCATLLQSFLRFFSRLHALGIFIIFFLFIESRLLLGFNFSGASLMGVIGGSISLLLFFVYENEGSQLTKKKLFFFSLLIFTGGLIRIHYMALFSVFVLWMGLFLLPRKKLMKLLKIQFFLGLLLVIFFQGQRLYFQKTIRGWREEEKLRKAHIYHSNHPRKKLSAKYEGIEKIKQDLISISFLYDRNLFDYQSVKKFAEDNTHRFKIVPNGLPSFYWLFMDMRVYLFLFAGMVIILLMNKSKRFLFLFFGMSFFSLLGLIILATYFKVTQPIFLAVMTSVLLSGFFCLARLKFTKLSVITGCFFVLLSCTWMIIRLVKINNGNKKKISYARNVINELNDHNNVLFVDAGSFFNLHLSIWDVPAKYPMRNFIYNELFFSNSYHSQLNKYSINDLMKEIPVKSNILLTGQRSQWLIDYYRILFGQQVDVKRIPGFNYIEVYRVIPGASK